ncbi:uncharacterized protein LOC129762121 [Toxorhynchites rutilus septentrionalis]|uniref:uncharacterized protein LOC129762121 n=1 Tax=Toxorhynchites rutilus septentrionalis TaxID=329112 RepID=UPI00247864AF|nr:uncharacterized protein LOC129762121 [Toxorhynchites rutilus septentrionalis]
MRSYVFAVHKRYCLHCCFTGREGCCRCCWDWQLSDCGSFASGYMKEPLPAGLCRTALVGDSPDRSGCETQQLVRLKPAQQSSIKMEYPQHSEQIKELQDTVITLRQDIPKLYKGLLMKECQVRANNLVEAKFNIPHQNMELLQNLRTIDLDGASLRGGPTQMRELHRRTHQLQDCLQHVRNQK